MLYGFVKKRYSILSYVMIMLIFLGLMVFMLPEVTSYAGKICGSASPCTCGSNCSGGNELYSQTQSYCDSNPVECFNTIDECKDGQYPTYNYVEDISVTSLNDSVFRVGDVIEIDATLYSYSVNSEGVFFVYANGTGTENVNWSVIYSTTFEAADSAYHIKYNYTIPNKVGPHSVRVIDIFSQVNNITCGKHQDAQFGAYSDTDEVVFTVLPQLPPTVNFTGPTPSNSSTQTSLTVIINVTHIENHPDTLILNWNGTNETYSYSGTHTAITKSNLKQGNYSFYIWLNDTYGNANQTETRTVSINNPIDITVVSPVQNGLYSSNLVDFNITIKPAVNNKTVMWAAYELNNEDNVTVSKKQNISADISDPDGILNQSLISNSNLSQSFISNILLETLNISIKLKKIGNPNSTLQIRTDNSGSPSDTVLANISIDNSSVSTTDFSWVNLSINETTTLQNGTKYWLFLSPAGTNEDHYAWEASDENISGSGECLQNTSRDLLFRIFDQYKYFHTFDINDGILVEGSNNLIIYANNSDGITVSSSISFTYDKAAPAYNSVTESDDPVQVGNELTITINVTDTSTNVDTVILEYNSTNYTMSNTIGDIYSISFTPRNIGLRNYTFYMNDSLGNLNISSRYNFTVSDSDGPGFSNITNTPNTPDGLDPLVLINVTAAITDLGIIDAALLQYKNSTSDWINATMTNTSTTSFFGTFTPDAAGIWTYRIWANDTYGNSNYSINQNLAVSYDYSWTRKPVTFDAISEIKDSVVTIGNLTINNTGDYLLGFDISADRAFISYNYTTTFTIEPHNYTTIEINATTPSEEAEYPIKITIDSENSTAEPGSLQTNATLVSITSGPYLYLEITQYNSSVPTGSSMDLIAKITNIGNETATNVVSNWSLPSDWSNIPIDLNRTLGNLGVNKYAYHNLSAIIPSGASTGSKTISIYSQSSEGANNTASESVTVYSTTTTTTTTTTTSSSGGRSGGGGGGGFLYTIPDYDLLIEGPKKIELIADQKRTIEINITNNVSGTELRSITTSVSGFLITKLDIEPEFIDILNYSTKRSIKLTIDVPKYMKYQDLTLTLTFTADAQDSRNNSKARSKLNKNYQINLIILEITKEIALQGLSQAESGISLIERYGYNSVYLQELLSEAKKYFEESDYKKTKDLTDKILLLKEKAITVNNLIKEIKEKITNSEKKGIDLSEAKEFLGLALELFNKGRFEESLEMADRALISERLSSKTAESSFFIIAGLFIKQNWLLILILSMFLIAAAIFVKKAYSIKAVAEKLKSYDQEEQTIIDLIKKSQYQYFKEKLMSDRIYKKTMQQYTREIATIQRRRIELYSRKISLFRMTNNYAALQEEKSGLKKLVKELQKKFYVSKLITEATYKQSISEFKKREIMIDEWLRTFEKEKINKIHKQQSFSRLTEPKLQKRASYKKDLPGFLDRQLNLKKWRAHSEESHINKSAIKKMLNLFEDALQELPKRKLNNKEIISLSRSYKEYLKKYDPIKFKIKEIFKAFGFKKSFDYNSIKSKMLKSLNEVYKNEK